MSELTEKQLIEKAKDSKDCLDWLGICNGECCKMFTVEGLVKNNIRVHKNTYISLPIKLSQDKINYYKLHNCSYDGECLNFFVKDVVQDKENDITFFIKPCEWQTSKGLCREHSNPKRPENCSGFVYETMDSGNWFIPPNCLFKYKKMGEHKK